MPDLDVRPWNLSVKLGVPFALLAACGRTIIVPEQDDPTADPSETTEATPEPSTTTEVGPECRQDSDCPDFWDCVDGVCQYEYDYCDENACCYDECCDGGCWYYECYSDDDCRSGDECVDNYCQPDPDPEPWPPVCDPVPIQFHDAVPLIEHVGPVSLAFVDAPTGERLVVGDGDGVALVDFNGVTPIGEYSVVALVAGDLDANGYEDLVVAEGFADGSLLRTYFNDPMLGFVAGDTLALPGMPVDALALADLDGGGAVDIVANTVVNDVARSVLVAYGQGGGEYGPPELFLDGDACGLTGVPRVAERAPSRLAFAFEGTARLAVSALRVDILSGPSDIPPGCVGAAGHFDGDGFPDFLLLDRADPRRLHAWSRVDDLPGSVSWEMPFEATALAVGDIDGLVGDEVVTSASEGATMVRYGGPSATPRGETDPLGCYNLFDLGFMPTVLVVGDLDGDAIGDIVGADDGVVYVAAGY